jgi:hypothetical protein
MVSLNAMVSVVMFARCLRWVGPADLHGVTGATFDIDGGRQLV